MARISTFCAHEVAGKAAGLIKDQVQRDEAVPALARRVRGVKATWVVHIKENGKHLKRTLGDCRAIPAEVAREMAREMLARAACPEAVAEAADTSPWLREFAEVFLADMASRWKASTLTTNRRVMTVHLLPAFGRRRLNTVSRDDVLAWMNGPGPKGAKNRALPVLSCLFSHAELKGLIPAETNPCKGLRRHDTSFKAMYLTEGDFAALGRVLRAHAATHPGAVAAIRFLALTGCRKAETLGLTWAMIDGNRAVLPDSKTGEKVIWLGKAARRVLAKCPKVSAFVFGASGRPLQATDLDMIWAEVRQALGKPRLRLHDLRHSFASVAIGAGHDLVVVGGLLGHKDKSSTEGYVHLTNKDVEGASLRVGAHLGQILKAADTRKAPRPRKSGAPMSIFKDYLKSRDGLEVFCAKRGLDPDRFRADLHAWRQMQGEGAGA